MLFEDEPEVSALRRMARRYAPYAVAFVLLASLMILLWNMAHDHTTLIRQTPTMPIVALTAPPPPPPPPPKSPPPPEPPKVQMETPQPQQNDQPKAPPQQLTINGPPQAGGDSFGLSAGNGGGSVIGGGQGPGGGGDGGFAESAYTRYLTGYIQQAVQQDDRVTRSVFQLDVQLWVDRGGRVTSASVVKTSGDGKLDRQVISVLQNMRLDQSPPAAFKNYFSHRITIRGRRA
ncbi:MAG TPA: energy transducer TonB [Caulobacteraceae bacterium]|nr:energy transducer TonB [Caulobacteraceae bacterium]